MARGIGTQLNKMPSVYAPAAASSSIIGVYWEVVFAASSGTALSSCAVGVCTTLPSDGSYIGQTTASWGWRSNGALYTNDSSSGLPSVNSFIADDVLSVLLTYSGHVFLAKNGVFENSGAPCFDLSSETSIYPAQSVVNNTGPDLTATVTFDASGMVYQAPSNFGNLTGAVLQDENSVTLTNGGLTSDEGAVPNHCPVRADTAVSLFSGSTLTAA